MEQIILFFDGILIWFESLNLADILGVIGFILSAGLILAKIIGKLARMFKKDRSLPDLSFKLEDVKHEMFKKKGFVTFDLYVRNNGFHPVEILRIGFVLSDGTEKTIYKEPHKVKMPDLSLIDPGAEAFFDDCDLFFTINEEGPCYKKIVSAFVDLRDKSRYYAELDIHPFLNDLTIRGILTDKKGLNGF